MSEVYFTNIPNITYNGKTAKNLLVKAKLMRDYLNQLYRFYPYTVKDHETPEFIANAYYGSPELDWLVYMSNEVINPYFSWPMRYDDFLKYLIKKYGSVETSQSTIHHYRYNQTVNNALVGESDLGFDYKSTYEMTKQTFDSLSALDVDTRNKVDASFNPGFWSPVYCYDWEFDENENRRTIYLVDNDLLNPILQSISKVFK